MSLPNAHAGKILRLDRSAGQSETFLLSPLDGGVIDWLHGGGALVATPAAHGTRAFPFTNEGTLFGPHAEAPATAATQTPSVDSWPPE